MIFVDDNIVECLAVQDRIPNMVVYHVPSNADEIPAWLAHAFGFDAPDGPIPMTMEDGTRTQLYQCEWKRKQKSYEYRSNDAFIASLGVRVDIRPLNLSDNKERERVLQLTHRTSQFTTASFQLHADFLEAYTPLNDYHIFTITVTDRFGDYGLVGVLLLNKKDNICHIPLWLLSCRVLNRGVEHKVMHFIGKWCAERTTPNISIAFQKTARNIPAFEFFERYCEKNKEAVYEITAEKATNVTFSTRNIEKNSFGVWQECYTISVFIWNTYILPAWKRTLHLWNFGVTSYLQEDSGSIMAMNVPPSTTMTLKNQPIYKVEQLSRLIIPETSTSFVGSHTYEQHIHSLQELSKDETSSSSSSSSTLCKLRRKLRHQAKEILDPTHSSTIWSATAAPAFKKKCSTTTCTLKIHIECSRERCKACCVHIRKLLVKTKSDNKLMAEKAKLSLREKYQVLNLETIGIREIAV